MKNQLSLFMVVALLLFPALACAYPNLSALTGVVGTPNAYLVGSGNVVAAADLLFFDKTTFNGRVLAGLSPKLEAGALITTGRTDGLGISAKYQFMTSPGGATWAFGGTFLAADDNDDGLQLFVVTSKAMTASGVTGPLLGSLGVAFTDVGDDSTLEPFIAAQLTAGPALTIDGEFMLDTGSAGDSIFSLVLRHHASPRLSMELGVTNADAFIGRDDYAVFLGASLATGGI